MNLELKWNDQLDIMLDKLKSNIKKIMAMDISPFQAYIYFNTYMLKSIYFGTGVM